MKAKFWATRHGITNIILFLVIGCKEKPKIDGFWIGTHTIHKDTLVESAMVRPLVFIENNRLTYRSIGTIDGIFDKVDSLSSRIQFKDSSLYLESTNEKITIIQHSNDSIIAFYPNNPSKKMIFNKIIEGYRAKGNENIFQDKIFSYIANDGTPNIIYFQKDSLALSYDAEKTLETRMTWELVNFKKQHFLLLDDAIGPIIMHLDSIEKNTAYLSEYSGAKSYPFVELSITNLDLDKGNLQNIK